MARIVNFAVNYKLDIAKLAVSFIFLTMGCAIYLGFRSTDILFYRFLDYIGLAKVLENFRIYCSAIYLPEWIRYSLPDGLWLSAYLLIINVVWRNHRGFQYYLFIYIMPALAILLEIAQYFGICPGTYDKIDLSCYIISLLIFTPLKYEF